MHATYTYAIIIHPCNWRISKDLASINCGGIKFLVCQITFQMPRLSFLVDVSSVEVMPL